MKKVMLSLMTVGVIIFACVFFDCEMTTVKANGAVAGEQIVAVAGHVVSNYSTTLQLSGAIIPDLDAFIVELSQFPILQRVELYGSNLNNAQMEILMATYPNVQFVWTIVLGGYWRVNTDQVAFSCNKGPGPNLTDIDLDQLKYCTNMVALDIGHNLGTNINFVRNMPQLRVIIISMDYNMVDISAISSCTNLIYFEAWTTSLFDLSPLSTLVNLKDINLCHTRSLTNIDAIMGLPNIERFYISDSAVPLESILAFKAVHPYANVNFTTWHEYGDGWRTHPRYYAMRNMYANPYYIDPLIL